MTRSETAAIATPPAAGDLWFSRDEYAVRLRAVQAELAARGCDALLAYQPESITYLTGFFTKGYRTSFQCALVPAQGEPTVILRDVETHYFDRTAAVTRRILWSDGDDVDEVTLSTVRGLVGESARIAVEKSSWVMNAQRFEVLRSGLPCAELVDDDRMVARLRLLKSSAEISYMRSAARAAERAMTAAAVAATPGASERDLAIAISSAMVAAGSDRAEPGPIASGERALHIHGGFTDRILQDGDLVHVEVTPHVRNYHSRFMRPVKVGRLAPDEIALARRLIAIQDDAVASVGPSVPAAVPDRIYRQGILATGAVRRYTNKTFYSVGLLLDPVTYESLEATPRSEWLFQEGMTFHTYLVVRGLCFSETILVTTEGCELLTRFPRDIIVGGA